MDVYRKEMRFTRPPRVLIGGLVRQGCTDPGLWGTRSRVNAARMRVDQPSIVAELTARVRTRLRTRLTEGTWRRRSYLSRTIQEFASMTGLRLGHPETAILALEWIGTGTMPRTILGYARTMRAAEPSYRSTVLDEYIASLAVAAAAEPVKKAVLMTKEQFRGILPRLPYPMGEMAWVAWVTASRWSDVANLSL
eukprot:PhF_6_TR36215/c1_g1_i1/m.52857